MSLPAQVFVCILQRTALPPTAASSSSSSCAATASTAVAARGEPEDDIDPGAPVPTVASSSSPSPPSPANASIAAPARHLPMPDAFGLACALYDQADYLTAIKHFEFAIGQICPTWTRHHARAARIAGASASSSSCHDPSGSGHGSSRSGRPSSYHRSRHERSHTSFIGAPNASSQMPLHGAGSSSAMGNSELVYAREGGFSQHPFQHASVYELAASAAPSTSASACVSVAGSAAGSPTAAAAHRAFPHHAVHMPFARGADGSTHAVHRPPALSACSPTNREQVMSGISSVCVVAPPSAVHSASPPLSGLQMSRISSSPDVVQLPSAAPAASAAASSSHYRALAVETTTSSSSLAPRLGEPASASAHLLSVSHQRASGSTSMSATGAASMGHSAGAGDNGNGSSGNGSSGNSSRHLSAHHPHARHVRSRSADRDLSSFSASSALAVSDNSIGERETNYRNGSNSSHDPDHYHRNYHHQSSHCGAAAAAAPVEPHSALLPPTQRPGFQRARSTQAPVSAGGPFTRTEPLGRAFAVAPSIHEGEDDRERASSSSSSSTFGHSMPITASAVASPPLASSLSADDRERLAMCHNGIACCLMQMTNYRPAKHHLYEALELMPVHHVFFFNLGTLHLERQEFDLAVTCFKKAVRQCNMVPAYHSNLGLAYKSQRDFNRALVALKSAVTLDRSNPSCLYNLACGCLAKFKYKEAVHYLRRAVEQDYNVSYKIGAVSRNSFAIYYTQLAYALLQMQQPSNAIYYASLAISIDCTLPHAHCHRALAFAALHTYCVAVCDAQQAVRAFHAGVWPSREDATMIDELRLAMLSWQGLLSNKSEQRDALALMNELSGLAVEASSVPTTMYEQVANEQQRLKKENEALMQEIERLRQRVV